MNPQPRSAFEGPGEIDAQDSRSSLRLPAIDECDLPGARFARSAVGVVVGILLVVGIIGAAGASLLTVTRTVLATGYIEPSGLTAVRSATGGRIVKMYVRPGTKVERDQVLAQLDTTETTSDILRLKGRVRATRLSMRRDSTGLLISQRVAEEDSMRALARHIQAGAGLRDQLAWLPGTARHTDSVKRPALGSHIGLDIATADLLIAEADARTARTGSLRSILASMELERSKEEVHGLLLELRLLNQKRTQLTIRAPSAGIVLSEDTDHLVGAIVDAGDQILEIGDTARWIAVVWVAERDVRRVALGADVSLRLPSQDPYAELRGKVQAVAPAATIRNDVLPSPRIAGNRYRVLVSVTRPSEDAEPSVVLKPGYAVEARIVTESVRAMALAMEYVRRVMR